MIITSLNLAISCRKNALGPPLEKEQNPTMAGQGAGLLEGEMVLEQLWFNQPFPPVRQANSHTHQGWRCTLERGENKKDAGEKTVDSSSWYLLAMTIGTTKAAKWIPQFTKLSFANRSYGTSAATSQYTPLPIIRVTAARRFTWYQILSSDRVFEVRTP
jgi:hypothetical protein